MWAPWLISIGNDVTITNSVLLTHDASCKKPLGYTKFAKVTIGDNVIIGPGSIVYRDVPSNSVAVGIPCKVVGKYDEYIEKTPALMENTYVIQKGQLHLIMNNNRIS